MNDLTVLTDAHALAELARNIQRELSYTSPDVAMRRPIADVVKAALDAACESDHTRRSYETAIALFLYTLETERGHLLPDAPGWLPLVQKEIDGVFFLVITDTGKTRVEYVFSEAPAAILRLVDVGSLDEFRLWRLAEGDSANTAQIRLYAVRTFLSVALRDGVLTHRQATNLGLRPYRKRQRRDQKPVGRRLNKSEVRTLREAVGTDTNKGKRDLCILDFALFAGLRESEIANLKMSHFQQDKGRWWIVLPGKGGKTRKLKIHDHLYQSLAAWRDAAGLDWYDERHLFYSVNRHDGISDTPISPTDVGRLVTSYGAKSGLAPAKGKGQLGAHDLRRTCARNAYDNGASLLLVQQMLGHADPKTTARYIGIDNGGDKAAVDFVRY